MIGALPYNDGIIILCHYYVMGTAIFFVVINNSHAPHLQLRPYLHSPVGMI